MAESGSEEESSKTPDFAWSQRFFDDKIKEAIVNLYRENRPPRSFDQNLHIYLRGELASIGATALLVQQADHDLSLYCWAEDNPTGEKLALKKKIPEAAARIIGEIRRGLGEVSGEHEEETRGSVVRGVEFHRLLPPDECALTFASSNEGDSALPTSRTASVAVLIFPLSEIKLHCFGDQKDVVWEQFYDLTFIDIIVKEYSSYFLPMILDAFRHREPRFAAFPPKVSRRYWDDAPFIPSDSPRERKNHSSPLPSAVLKELEGRLSPPWNHRPDRRLEDLIPTATLSLDLRKSTFCMEYASSEKEFGQWLDLLVEMMRSVAHPHGGVFDKFTGDGALIHFLEKECLVLYGKKAVDSAIHCAVDLQRAVEIHMKALREKLHHNSPVFGAGIAIDVGDAFWSVDHRDNPIVVGKVVVGACRLADKAPRRFIRLTNWAYWSATPDLRNSLKNVKEVSLSTKDSSEDVPLLCWEFTVDDDLNVGRGLPVIEDLCKKIKERFEASRGRTEPSIA